MANATRLKLRITRVLEADALMRQVEPRFTNLMNAMGRRAQRLVPKRTWALHDTIAVGVENHGDSLEGTLGAGGGKVNYATMVELGTSRMAAQPYLRPAMLQSTSSDFGNSTGIDDPHGVVPRKVLPRRKGGV